MKQQLWTTIQLDGHGTSAAFPEGMFAPAPKSEATLDAVRWIASDGAEVSLWNEIKPQGASLESLLKQQNAFIEMVTRSEIESAAILVEGFDADWFVHRRIKLGASGRMHGVEIRYEYARKPSYETIAANICASLGGE